MPTDKKSVRLLNHVSGNPEDISQCLCLEVTSDGFLSLKRLAADGQFASVPGCSGLSLQKITNSASGHVLTVRASVAAGSGSAFVHFEPLAWYPRCTPPPQTTWLGDSVSPMAGALYPYENDYAVAQAGGDSKKIPAGMECLELTIEIMSTGCYRSRTDRSELTQHIGPGEPVTGKPAAHVIILGVFKDAQMTIDLAGLEANAPAALQASISFG